MPANAGTHAEPLYVYEYCSQWWMAGTYEYYALCAILYSEPIRGNLPHRGQQLGRVLRQCSSLRAAHRRHATCSDFRPQPPHPKLTFLVAILPCADGKVFREDVNDSLRANSMPMIVCEQNHAGLSMAVARHQPTSICCLCWTAVPMRRIESKSTTASSSVIAIDE